VRYDREEGGLAAEEKRSLPDRSPARRGGEIVVGGQRFAERGGEPAAS